jgi:hypothetical protein
MGREGHHEESRADAEIQVSRPQIRQGQWLDELAPLRSRSTPGRSSLNLPYHPRYERLFVAYIAGITALGLAPRTALELTSGARRLDRIRQLLEECRYSVHDLSYLKLDPPAPKTPRFNMPFELGVAYSHAHHSAGGHEWFVFDAKPYCLQKSLSDLNGTDVFIHGGTVEGVLRELSHSFINAESPTLDETKKVYRALRRAQPQLLQASGSTTVFAPRAFKQMALLARELTDWM